MQKIFICFIFGLSCALGGCDSIMNFANSIGDHMPVVGDRCEHWQCFTNPTQSQSANTKTSSPSNGAANNLAASSGVTPTTQAATSKSNAPTPFDMTPEQLQNLPPPIPAQPGMGDLH